MRRFFLNDGNETDTVAIFRYRGIPYYRIIAQPYCKLDLLTIDPGLCIDRFLLLLLLLLVLINLAVGKQCSCALLPPSDTTTLKHTPRGGGSGTLM